MRRPDGPDSLKAVTITAGAGAAAAVGMTARVPAQWCFLLATILSTALVAMWPNLPDAERCPLSRKDLFALCE